VFVDRWGRWCSSIGGGDGVRRNGGGDGVRRSVGAMVFVGSVGGDGWEGGSVGAMGGKVERDVR
jgi:hypothetical protein